MPSLSRRDALRLSGCALVGGFAGCLGSGQQSPTTSELAELSVTNQTPNRQTAHILILEDDEPVYWQTKQVPAAEGNDWGGFILDGVPAEPADYVVHARVNSQPESQWKRFDCGEYDISCLKLDISIRDSDPTEVMFWYTGDESECQGPPES